jgi:protein-S-isoprenylcysteine O-methyltransferase Ste14
MNVMWVLRLYLLAGLVIHKAIWESLKRRTANSPRSSVASAVKVVKAGKIALLLALIAQTLAPAYILPISRDPLGLCTLGVILYTVGLVVAISARCQLGTNWSDIETPQVGQRQEVVSNGIYRYIRHPIYAGDLLLLLGLELALNSWLVLAIVLLVPVVLRRAVLEEKLLAKRLRGYDSYARRTKRFIPFVV